MTGRVRTQNTTDDSSSVHISTTTKNFKLKDGEKDGPMGFKMSLDRVEKSIKEDIVPSSTTIKDDKTL